MFGVHRKFIHIITLQNFVWETCFQTVLNSSELQWTSAWHVILPRMLRVFPSDCKKHKMNMEWTESSRWITLQTAHTVYVWTHVARSKAQHYARSLALKRKYHQLQGSLFRFRSMFLKDGKNCYVPSTFGFLVPCPGNSWPKTHPDSTISRIKPREILYRRH